MDTERTYENVLLVRYGEVSLKGQNKPWFERKLRERVIKALAALPDVEGLKTERRGGMIVVSGFDGAPREAVIRAASKVFGVASVSPAWRIEDRSMEALCAAAVAYMSGIQGAQGVDPGSEPAVTNLPVIPACEPESPPVTFKIYAKRADKSYPVQSPEMGARIGEAVLGALAPGVSVDVHDPDIRLTVHLRPDEVFLYDEKHAGYGGLPLGTNGRGLVLLSGGIDSPVAAWLMAKRGMRIEAVHFHSYPYTSMRAQEKVEELGSILADYCGDLRMHVVNLLPAQEAIAGHCPEEYMTLLVRRFMMRIAERIARAEGCDVLVTGESLGQVASQTAEALVCTDAAVTIPVMRPLIALDKVDIMDFAREIGTYEKSIEPYEDCCTVFLPKHPATRPKKEDVLEAESRIPRIDELMDGLLCSRILTVLNSRNK
jgi:thiamine biosynthesis protein ThiI